VVSPDGSRVVGCPELIDGGFRKVGVWNTGTGKLACPLLEHTQEIHHIALSSDGKRLVTACGKLGMNTLLGEGLGEACLWDVTTGQQIRLPLRHPQRVSHTAFSRDGRLVVTACDDGIARVWDATTEMPAGRVLVHQAGLAHVSLSIDGRRIMTFTQSGIARVWESQTGQPLTPPLEITGTPNEDDGC
jgi:WD40 repeat protein